MLEPAPKIKALLVATLDEMHRVHQNNTLCENCGYPFWHHTGKDMKPPINLCPYPRQDKRFKPVSVVVVKR